MRTKLDAPAEQPTEASGRKAKDRMQIEPGDHVGLLCPECGKRLSWAEDREGVAVCCDRLWELRPVRFAVVNVRMSKSR